MTHVKGKIKIHTEYETFTRTITRAEGMTQEDLEQLKKMVLEADAWFTMEVDGGSEILLRGEALSKSMFVFSFVTVEPAEVT